MCFSLKPNPRLLVAHLLPSLRAAAGGLLRRRGCRFPPSGPHLPSLHLQYQSISLPPHAAGFRSRGHLPPPHPPPHLNENPNVTPRPAPSVDLSPWLRLLEVFVGERIGRCLGSFQGEGGGAQCGSIRIGLRCDLARVVRCLGESRLVDPCCCCRLRKVGSLWRSLLCGWATCGFSECFVLDITCILVKFVEVCC